MTRVVVLVDWHEHPVSARPVRNRGDAVAAALALQCGAADVHALHAGEMPDAVARDYLALGLPRIELLTPAGPAHDVVPMLKPSLESAALIVTGTRSDGGLRSGMLPYELGAQLQRPVITDVVDVRADGAAWRVLQACARGARRTLLVGVPAVIVVHPSAPVALRDSHRDRVGGTLQRLRAPSTADQPASPWRSEATARQLQRLQAARARSGHDRMLGAIATEGSRAAGTVLKEGTAADKAQAVWAYLQRHALLPTTTN